MCGIAGYIGPQHLNAQTIARSIHHRGPDNTGSLQRTVGGHSVGLVHNRLSIIDLSKAANQPMSLPQGLHLVFNGEIYNYRALKRRFLNNSQFFSTSDTEVLLRLWEKLGADCLQYINGDFAFAILDERKNSLHLVRDRLGVKPLYYGQQEDYFYFGSEIKALEAAGMGLSIDHSALSQFLVFKYVPGQNTLYQNVHRLAPGSVMEIDLNSGRQSTRKYWQPKFGKTALGYSQTRERIREIMEDSVALRLHADVNVCNFFSGGLDSSIIAVLAGKSNFEIQHFTAVKSAADLKNEGTSSDATYARKLAKEKSLQLREVPLADDLLNPDLLSKVFSAVDDPIADGSIIPGYLIAQEASKSARVALGGMGADELFLGYGGHKLSRIARYFDRVPGGGKLAGAMAGISVGKGSAKFAKRWMAKFAQGYSQPHRDAVFSVVGQISSALQLLPDTGNTVASVFESYFPKNRDNFESLFAFELDNFLVKNLHYLDGVCMANSMEARVPFLDHRLVELAAQIPADWKLDKQLRGKRILINAFREKLPGYIYKRRKAGFGMPLRSMLAKPENLNRLLDPKALESNLGIDYQQTNRVCKIHQQGQSDESALIWALITLQHATGVRSPG